jgi:hypothetical protein
LLPPDAPDAQVALEVRMPPLKRRIAMNLSLAEQPHNGIELNGERLPGEPLVGSTGTTFDWGKRAACARARGACGG